MAKPTIIVTEKTEQLSDGHSITGYATSVEFEPEGQEGSSLRELVQPIYKFIGCLMTAYHGNEPYEARDLNPGEPFSIKEEMAKEAAKIDQPFPSEL